MIIVLISALFAISLSAQISIIGPATPSGNWETDYYMTQDAQNPDLWGINIHLTTGEVKFRKDGNWEVNWGGTTFPDGNGYQDGPNIIVNQEENYYVTLNTSTGAYQFSIFAPGSSGITHQAIIRNAANELLTNQSIGVRVSVIQYAANGPVVYSETHNPISNANGLITFVIGHGAGENNFSEIDWADGPYWLETKADPTGGEDYSITGITKFFSVPYSMYAEFAGHAQTFAGLDALLARIEALEEALDIDAPIPYNLNLQAAPEDAGSVSGAGTYQAGEQVSINAIPNEGWEFVNWTGDAEHLDDANSAEATVTMPSDDVTLTAVFLEEDDPGIVYGDGVTDIDGNEYLTVIIGDQEWMAENLRVTMYNNEEGIDTGLGNIAWQYPTSGAYAIYNNDNDMLEAYGKLYNWLAVDDSRGLCPEGWSVPSDDDWTQLIDYVTTHGFPNSNLTNGAGNALKSCRQIGSPLDGCNTNEHPRWESNNTYYGFNEFGFSAHPGGSRFSNGSFIGVGLSGSWWSNTEDSSLRAWGRTIYSYFGIVDRFDYLHSNGLSVRCFRDILPPEDD